MHISFDFSFSNVLFAQSDGADRGDVHLLVRFVCRRFGRVLFLFADRRQIFAQHSVKIPSQFLAKRARCGEEDEEATTVGNIVNKSAETTQERVDGLLPRRRCFIFEDSTVDDAEAN